MFKEKIDVGVEWLDAHEGPNWPHKIRTIMLQMWSGCDCIIGQLHEEYQAVFNPGDELPYDLGFAIHTNHLTPEEGDRLYSILTQEWKEKIIELRNDKSRIPAVNIR